MSNSLGKQAKYFLTVLVKAERFMSYAVCKSFTFPSFIRILIYPEWLSYALLVMFPVIKK